MSERIPQSVTKRVALKAYLSSDHLSDATGKTIAVTISKNGAAFGNPSAGATNATEIANGWYYVDLSTTDTGTAGPLIVRGTASGVDNVESLFVVADAHNAGFDGVPSAVAGASGGLPTGDASGRVDLSKIAGAAVSTSVAQIGVNAVNIGGTAQTGRDIGASVLVGDKTGFSLAVTPPTAAQVRTEMDSNSTKLANLDVVLSTRLAASSYTSPPSAASIRTEIDTNSTKLDVATSTRLAAADYAAPSTPPTVVQIRQEMDSNSTKLANLDAAISTRSTYAGADTSGTATLLSRLTSTRAGLLDNLDAAISSLPSLSAIASTVWANVSRTLTSSFPSVPTANQNADALFDQADGVETGWTFRQALRIVLSALGGDLSGAETGTVNIKDVNNTKNRIVAPVDANGNRTGVTLDAS